MSYCYQCQRHVPANNCAYHGELSIEVPNMSIPFLKYPFAPGYNVKVDNLFQYDNQTKPLPTYEKLVARNIEYATQLVKKGLVIKSLKEDYLALDRERVRLNDKLRLSEILTTTSQEERKKAEKALAQSREAGMKKAMDLVDEIKENEALKKQIDSLRRSLANEDIINQGLHEKVKTLEAQLKQSFLREDCLAHNLDTARDTIRINREYHEADLRRLQNTSWPTHSTDTATK